MRHSGGDGGGGGRRAINNAGENEQEEKEERAGTEEESETVTYNKGEMGANTHCAVPAFSRRSAVIASVSNRKSPKSISRLGKLINSR